MSLADITSVLVGNRLIVTVNVTLLDDTPQTPDSFEFIVLNTRDGSRLAFTHSPPDPDVLPATEEPAMDYGTTVGQIVFEFDVDDPGTLWMRFDASNPKVAIERRITVKKSKVIATL